VIGNTSPVVKVLGKAFRKITFSYHFSKNQQTRIGGNILVGRLLTKGCFEEQNEGQLSNILQVHLDPPTSKKVLR